MKLHQVGKFPSASIGAIAIGASIFHSALSGVLVIGLVLAPLVALISLTLMTAIFGRTRISNRAFRVICLLLDAATSRR
jgi:uncharacterized membrane protein